jgi:hypothetical protein
LSDEPDLALLQDEVRAAELAVRHWATHVIEAEHATHALDGWFRAALYGVLGTREAKIAAAVERYQRAAAALTGAKERLEVAEAALAWATDRAAQGHAEEARARAELDALAAQIVASDHPLTAPLAAIEHDLATARRRVDTATAGFEAASGALGALGEIVRAGTKAESAALHMALWNLPLEDVRKWTHLRTMQGALARWREAAARLQAVVDDIGLQFVAGGTDERAAWGWLLGGSDSLWLDLHHHRVLEQQTQRFDALRDEVRMLIDGFVLERNQAADEVASLDARRTSLLEPLRTRQSPSR